MLSNHVGNVDSIESVLSLRVSIVIALCFHYITLLVHVLTQEAKKWDGDILRDELGEGIHIP